MVELNERSHGKSSDYSKQAISVSTGSTYQHPYTCFNLSFRHFLWYFPIALRSRRVEKRRVAKTQCREGYENGS